jgi:hypothetical protein
VRNQPARQLAGFFMAIKSFNPGAFFLGTLVPAERSYMKILIQNARGCGYKRFVEP